MAKSKKQTVDAQPSAKPGEAITIKPVVDALALQTMQLAAEAELLAFAGGLVIDDDTTAEVIGQCLSEELGRFDLLEEMRTSATGPLNFVKLTIDSWFKPGKDKCKALIKLYKDALGAYHSSKQAVRNEALQLAAGAAKSGDVPALTAALTLANAPEVKPTGVGYSTKWQAKIVDLRQYIDAAVMQQKYWLVREEPSGLQKLAIGDGEPAAFPGVVFEQVTNVRAFHAR